MELEQGPRVCSVCFKSEHMNEDSKIIYEIPTCKKCAKGFINRREAAFLIDIVLWYLAMSSLGFFFDVPQTEQSIFQLSIFFWIIFFLKDGFSGYSIGKVICGIRVYHEPSEKPSGFLTSFKRNVIMIVPVIILFLLIDIKKGYRVGDSWAKTKVVWEKHKDKAPFLLGISD